MHAKESIAREMYETGDRWTDRIAELAMPIVLWCAKRRRTITYGQLVEELFRRHGEKPRTITPLYGQPAGKIGNIIEALSDEWGEPIPPVNALIVNASKGVPGSGVDGYLEHFLNETARRRLHEGNRTSLAQYVIKCVHDYPKWDAVAAHLGIRRLPTVSVLEDEERQPFLLPDLVVRYGGGESDQHRRLKEWTAEHPGLFAQYGSLKRGKTEVALLSGDQVDVLFTGKDGLLAIEVKAANAPESELWRGVFQCVKYKAVLQAQQFAAGEVPNAQAILAVQRGLPDNLSRLARRLGVPYIIVTGE